jgi:hypothetical protein
MLGQFLFGIPDRSKHFPLKVLLQSSHYCLSCLEYVSNVLKAITVVIHVISRLLIRQFYCILLSVLFLLHYNLTLVEIQFIPLLIQASSKPFGSGLIQTCLEDMCF